MDTSHYTHCVWGANKQTGQLWLLWRCYGEDDANLLSAMEDSRLTDETILRIEVHDAEYNEYELNDSFAFRDRREWNQIVSNPSLANEFYC